MKNARLFWWIDRWRDSAAYKSLSLSAQALHRELIGQIFLRGGSLPYNFDALRRVTGTTPDEWNQFWPSVSAFWKIEGDRLLPGDDIRLYASRYRRLPPLVLKARRPEIPNPVKRFVFSRDDGKCTVCQSEDRLEIDHITRWRDGGRHTTDNLRLLCLRCNRSRG